MKNVKFEIIDIDLNISIDNIIDKHINTVTTNSLELHIADQKAKQETKKIKELNRNSKSTKYKESDEIKSKLNEIFNILYGDRYYTSDQILKLSSELITTMSAMTTKLKRFIEFEKNNEYKIEKTKSGYKIINR